MRVGMCVVQGKLMNQTPCLKILILPFCITNCRQIGDLHPDFDISNESRAILPHKILPVKTRLMLLQQAHHDQHVKIKHIFPSSNKIKDSE